MNRGEIQLAELVTKLETAPQAFFRMALRHREGQWQLHTLVLNVFPQEANAEAQHFVYDYGQAVFLAGTVTGMQAVA